ncbi:hypothetical protein, partial [Mycobacterium sp.]|uniref:hypothetical protein n=1 Tax=Mycobacterium sp. TaxID=1785 RepID=UPI002C87D3C6
MVSLLNSDITHQQVSTADPFWLLLVLNIRESDSRNANRVRYLLNYQSTAGQASRANPREQKSHTSS